MFGSKTQDEFNKALHAYLTGARKVYDEHCDRNGYSMRDPDYEVQWGKKYVRVVNPGSGVHSFVDMATGDVLKSASWAKPAKHARGNIYAEDHGLTGMGPYGPAYLR